MKSIKVIFTVSMLLFICIICSSCSSNVSENQVKSIIAESINKHNSENVSDDVTTNKKTIVFVGKSEGDKFIEEIKKNIQKDCKEKEYNFISSNSKDSSQIVKYQKQTLQELAISKVDGIILAPASSTELVLEIKKIQEAKIPMVIIDTNIDENEAKKNGLEKIPFVTVDNEKSAYDETKLVINKMIEEKKIIKPLIICGDLNSINAMERKDGTIKALAENSIQPVSIEDGKWKISNGYNITKIQLQQYQDINLIICGNDEMALGANQYLQETNRGDIAIVGFDGSPRTIESIKKGQIKLTIKQDKKEIAKASLQSIINSIQGKSNLDIVNIKTDIINSGNIH
ncbi:putative transcriptional regulator, periplasmic binding protein of LacI family protein [Clostridium botulinum C str. Eklund]|nr:putative transcriptional regulator, periplasmic binding protein of LacI family protein [Clostridium botulinum C str. Eklund]